MSDEIKFNLDLRLDFPTSVRARAPSCQPGPLGNQQSPDRSPLAHVYIHGLNLASFLCCGERIAFNLRSVHWTHTVHTGEVSICVSNMLRIRSVSGKGFGRQNPVGEIQPVCFNSEQPSVGGCWFEWRASSRLRQMLECVLNRLIIKTCLTDEKWDLRLKRECLFFCHIL